MTNAEHGQFNHTPICKYIHNSHRMLSTGDPVAGKRDGRQIHEEQIVWIYSA